MRNKSIFDLSECKYCLASTARILFSLENITLYTYSKYLQQHVRAFNERTNIELTHTLNGTKILSLQNMLTLLTVLSEQIIYNTDADFFQGVNSQKQQRCLRFHI